MKEMKQLIELFAQFLSIVQGNRVGVQFYTEQIYKSTKWTKASADLNITDITFYNASTAGTVYVNRIPLAAGVSKTFSCTWNEVNITDYVITIDEATVTSPLLIIDFKRISKPK